MDVSLVQEGGDVVFLAGVEAARLAAPAGGLDVGLQRFQFRGVAAPRKDGETLGCEAFRDRRADEIAGPDDRAPVM